MQNGSAGNLPTIVLYGRLAEGEGVCGRLPGHSQNPSVLLLSHIQQVSFLKLLLKFW